MHMYGAISIGGLKMHMYGAISTGRVKIFMHVYTKVILTSEFLISLVCVLNLGLQAENPHKPVKAKTSTNIQICYVTKDYN
jgi:hypothetical protein